MSLLSIWQGTHESSVNPPCSKNSSYHLVSVHQDHGVFAYASSSSSTSVRTEWLHATLQRWKSIVWLPTTRTQQFPNRLAVRQHDIPPQPYSMTLPCAAARICCVTAATSSQTARSQMLPIHHTWSELPLPECRDPISTSTKARGADIMDSLLPACWPVV